MVLLKFVRKAIIFFQDYIFESVVYNPTALQSICFQYICINSKQTNAVSKSRCLWGHKKRLFEQNQLICGIYPN
jgi:hypothetical protein